MKEKQLELPLLANREWGLKQLDQALEELGAEVPLKKKATAKAVKSRRK